MEGEIRLVSEPGLGSCFIVRLPLKMPDLSATAEPEAPSTFTPVLDGLVVGLCITLRELYQATEQVLLHHAPAR
ncbi:hypothetical protein AWV80_40195 [Cupriavidus sp. UYMU48A]|nr:hypothetical protein AWV80_40195 [Cupriavidus sp. UYMU48A]